MLVPYYNIRQTAKEWIILCCKIINRVDFTSKFNKIKMWIGK